MFARGCIGSSITNLVASTIKIFLQDFFLDLWRERFCFHAVFHLAICFRKPVKKCPSGRLTTRILMLQDDLGEVFQFDLVRPNSSLIPSQETPDINAFDRGNFYSQS